MANFNEKLAGRFHIVRKDIDKIIVRCIGALKEQKLNQEDVDFICRFYMINPTEKWLRDGSNLIIYKEEN